MMGAVLLVTLALIYFLPIPVILLRLALWAPILYDLWYLYQTVQDPTCAYMYLLIIYAMVGTEIMLVYYSSSHLKRWGTMIVLIVTLSDILQYVCGKYFGRTLTGGPSPKKTWEGYFGVVLATGCFWYWVPIQESLFWCLCGVFGDIFESWCKRRLFVKDSSDLLGAHGGWLDRLDGIFMAMIISQLYLG